MKSPTHVRLDEARPKTRDSKYHDVISELFPPIDLGLVEAQSAKQLSFDGKASKKKMFALA